MVNLILKYIKAPLTAYLPFVTKVDAPVYRISSGEVFSGVGSEKENVSISDNVGKGLYIRQIQQEQVKEKKKFTSCDKEYEITARCKAVFYSFSQDEFIINPDKISARIQGALKKVTFEQYTGSAKEITIDILSASTDFEKIFTEETGKQFEGDNWPLIVSVEFNLNYEDINCVACDIDDSETVVTWTPDLTPENCETKAICEAVAGCQVVKDLQAETESLQEQIDNLPTSGLTCDDLPECQTIIDIEQEISDLQNSNLGLIKIVDLNGDFFTDLASANAYISTFTSATISDESFNDGVYYFTVPKYSDFSNANNFLSDMFVKTAAIIDEFGLISVYGESLLSNVSSEFDSIFGDVITCGINSFDNFSGTVTLHKIVTDFSTFKNTAGTFNIHTVILTGSNPTDFFLGSTATILTNKYNFGNTDLIQAATNGANVQYDGINLASIDSVANVASDLSTHESDTNNPHNVTLEQARNENSSISGDINANSNTIINLKDAVNPQEPITKMQFDTYVSSVGGQRGPIDCSSNPNYPASNKGDRWEVTVAGIIGGALGITVQVYDEIVCKTTSVAGDQATVGSNFYVVQGNIERATESVAGYTQFGDDTEVQTGTDNTKSVNILKLANWWTWIKTQTQTFAAKITFTTSPRFSSTTASQYLKVDSSKDLTSVANIPATDITTDSTHRFITDTQLTNLANQSNTNTGNETASSIASIHHGATSKTVLVDADEVPGQDSASGFSLIRTTWLQVWNYIKTKSDAAYLPISQTITDYASTSTIVGFSSFTTKIIQVINMGAYDLINYDIGGTSNTTTLNFTIPNALSASAPAVSSIMHSLSGATNGSGIAQLAVGATTVNCYLNVSAGTWTASGTKRVRGTIIVQK